MNKVVRLQENKKKKSSSWSLNASRLVVRFKQKGEQLVFTSPTNRGGGGPEDGSGSGPEGPGPAETQSFDVERASGGASKRGGAIDPPKGEKNSIFVQSPNELQRAVHAGKSSRYERRGPFKISRVAATEVGGAALKYHLNFKKKKKI